MKMVYDLLDDYVNDLIAARLLLKKEKEKENGNTIEQIVYRAWRDMWEYQVWKMCLAHREEKDFIDKLARAFGMDQECVSTYIEEVAKPLQFVGKHDVIRPAYRDYNLIAIERDIKMLPIKKLTFIDVNTGEEVYSKQVKRTDKG